MSSRDYPEIVSELALILTEVLRSNGISSQHAGAIGAWVAEKTRERFSGMEIYNPKRVGTHSEFVSFLMSCVEEELAAIGTSSASASSIAKAAAQSYRNKLGGFEIYFPQARLMKNDLRDTEIYAKFNGCNLDDLARTYKLTAQRVRQIIQSVRRKKSQSLSRASTR